MASVPFVKNKEIVQYSFPRAMIFGSTSLMGLIGTVVSFIRIPNEIYKWTTLALSAICVTSGIFGFWKTRTVTLTLPEVDEDAIKTHLQFLKKISKKLDKMIPSDKKPTPNSSAELSSFQKLKKEIKSKIQAVRQQFESLNNKVEDLETDLANLSKLVDGFSDEESTQTGEKALQTADELSQRLKALMNSNQQSGSWSNSSSVTSSPQLFTPNQKGFSATPPASRGRINPRGTKSPLTPSQIPKLNFNIPDPI